MIFLLSFLFVLFQSYFSSWKHHLYKQHSVHACYSRSRLLYDWKPWPKFMPLKRSKPRLARSNHRKQKHVSCFKPNTFRVDWIFASDDFLKVFVWFIIANAEFVLSCFQALNNRKIWVSCQKLNFACIRTCTFVFVGPFHLDFFENHKNSSHACFALKDAKKSFSGNIQLKESFN